MLKPLPIKASIAIGLLLAAFSMVFVGAASASGHGAHHHRHSATQKVGAHTSSVNPAMSTFEQSLRGCRVGPNSHETGHQNFCCEIPPLGVLATVRHQRRELLTSLQIMDTTPAELRRHVVMPARARPPPVGIPLDDAQLDDTRRDVLYRRSLRLRH